MDFSSVKVVDGIFVFSPVVDLFFTEVSNSDLEDGNTEFVGAAHHTGVAMRAALVSVTEVSVGVYLDDAEILSNRMKRFDRG